MAATQPVDSPSREEVTPHQYQVPFLWNKHRYYGFMSGVGAGKTAAGAMRAAANVEHWNPGEMGAIVAPSTQMVKNAIIPVMREFGIMDSWEYHGPQAEQPGFVAPDGTRIVVLSADNDKTIERLAALNLAWWWLDEARLTPERVRQILIQRLRKGTYTNGFITTTPQGHDHNYDFFIGDQPDVDRYAYGDATIYETDDRLAVTGVPTDANPTLREQDTKAIREAHPDGLLQQEVEGLFVEIGSGLLTRDMLQFVHADDIPERELSWKVVADLGIEADPKKAQDNDTDYWAAAIIAYDGLAQQAYLVDVTRTRGMTKDQGVGWLSAIMDGVPTNQVGIEANQAQIWFVEDAKKAGLNAYGIKNDRSKEERLTYLSVPFANGRIKLVNHDDPDERPPGLEYDPRWESFVSEWLAFPSGAHDDMLDATEMALRQLDLGGSIQAVGERAYGDR